MTDFNALLLRLLAAAVLVSIEPSHPNIINWSGAALLMVGFKTRYAAAVLGVLGLSALARLPWDFISPSAFLEFAGTGMFTMVLFVIAVLGAGGFSMDEWVHSRRIAGAETACRTANGHAAGNPQGSLEATVSRCMDIKLQSSSRLRAWLQSPSNPEIHTR
ncbi:MULTISPECIES: DoxX family protein [unclassified Luteimonas]